MSAIFGVPEIECSACGSFPRSKRVAGGKPRRAAKRQSLALEIELTRLNNLDTAALMATPCVIGVTRRNLRHCSAHGLRKACATALAEAGATAHEIASVTGHQSLEEIERYTRDAKAQAAR